MKVIYTGSHAGLAPSQQRKVQARFAKLGKLLDSRKGEKEARVFLSAERHLTLAEITVNFYDRKLAGVEKDPDMFTALSGAIDKLEKQLLKTRTKWRDTKRASGPKRTPKEEAEAAVPAGAEAAEALRVYRVNRRGGRKPMTVEEAMLALEDGSDYVVYRDAESDKLRVLLKRSDGHFDLVEA